MDNEKLIVALIEGKKLDSPIEIDTTQRLLLEAVRELRGIYGRLTYLAVLATIGGLIALFRWFMAFVTGG